MANNIGLPLTSLIKLLEIKSPDLRFELSDLLTPVITGISIKPAEVVSLIGAVSGVAAPSVNIGTVTLNPNYGHIVNGTMSVSGVGSVTRKRCSLFLVPVGVLGPTFSLATIIIGVGQILSVSFEARINPDVATFNPVVTFTPNSEVTDEVAVSLSLTTL